MSARRWRRPYCVVAESTEQQRDHSIGAQGVVGSGRWNAEVRDRAEQIQRIRPSADQSRVLSTIKERLERRPDVFLEVLAQPAEGGIFSWARTCVAFVLAGVAITSTPAWGLA